MLLASLGLTAAAAIDAQRAIRSQRRIAELALKDYSSFAAWSYAQHLRDTLAIVVREALGAVNHGEQKHVSRDVPRAARMVAYLPFDSACMCRRPRAGPLPDAFFAIKIGSPALDVGPAPTNGGWPMTMGMAMEDPRSMPEGLEQPVDAIDSSRWLVDSLTRRIRGLGRVDHGYTLVIGDVDGRPRMIAYTLMPTAWGDTMVYGARYSSAAFARIAAGVLDASGLLPVTFTAGRRNRDVVAVRLRDSRGHTLFDSAPRLVSDVSAHLTVPDPAGNLSLDATIRPEVAGSLIIGGLPKSHLPFLLGLLGLAAALSIVAVTQIRRDGELARLRAEFVSSVSHELRTPVAQIRLYLDTLRLGRASTDAQREWTLEHIDRETTRLTHLVENVLRFSSLGYDVAAPAEPIDVSAEVRRIVQEFEPLAASRRASLAVTTDETPPLRVRSESLRHIVINLLDNAVKYGPAEQTIRVSVSYENYAIAIAVDDQGPGIAVADRERVWRPFTRGDGARDKGGSGIGLTIVREVARAYSGSARVETAPSGGARFVVTLPIAPALPIAHVAPNAAVRA